MANTKRRLSEAERAERRARDRERLEQGAKDGRCGQRPGLPPHY